MGINGLLPELPGGSMPSTKTGFDLLTPLLHDEKNPADMDMGTLVYVCALTHKSTYNDGNYIPALREFQRRLTILTSVYRWKINCVFDGKPPHEKRHEHTRRSNREDSISITSQFILMCKEVCRGSFIDYIIAPNEADSQVGRCFNEYTSSALVLCRDTDELAYGNKDVVFIDSFYTEDWRRVNMNTPVTDQIKKDYPLYAYYHKYGIKIIHWWAAVCGCDISVNRSGIMGAGKATFMSALQSFDNKVASLLTPRLFSKALQKFGSLACTVEDIEKELARVSDYFSKRGTYYDRAGNIYSVEGKLIQRANKTTRRHMKGELNPKTVAELTADEKRGVASVKPHNLLHNSAVCRDKINGISLPENRSSIDDCIVEELKAMIICRGGSLTGKDGKALTRPQLLLQLKAYMKLEKQKPSSIVYFDRGRCNNGIFAKIDTSERRSLPQMLIDLVNTAGYEPNIHAFFVDLLRYCNEGKFVDDFGTIALEAPEITEAFIVEEFCHIGDSKKQKNIASALKKVMEMDELLYHAVATADDGKSILIVSKQRASQNHDEKTRNKTDYGEKPKFAEYLAMCQLAVKPTTHSSHGHTLGVCTRVLRSFCAQCKAGVGLCYHQGSLLQAQLHHWGEGRPTEKPATVDYCSWVPGSKQAARTCTTKQLASKQHIMQLPGSNEEAKEKLERGIKKNVHEGISATYDVYGGNEEKKAKLNDPHYVSIERISKLFAALEVCL